MTDRHKQNRINNLPVWCQYVIQVFKDMHFALILLINEVNFSFTVTFVIFYFRNFQIINKCPDSSDIKCWCFMKVGSSLSKAMCCYNCLVTITECQKVNLSQPNINLSMLFMYLPISRGQHDTTKSDSTIVAIVMNELKHTKYF